MMIVIIIITIFIFIFIIMCMCMCVFYIILLLLLIITSYYHYFMGNANIGYWTVAVHMIQNPIPKQLTDEACRLNGTNIRGSRVH